MFLAIFCALLCFGASILMLSPYFRRIPLLRPMAFYLIFEGAWQIFSYLITELYPTSVVPDIVGRIGTSAIIIYYIFIMVMTRTKSRRKNSGTKNSKNKKRDDR